MNCSDDPGYNSSDAALDELNLTKNPLIVQMEPVIEASVDFVPDGPPEQDISLNNQGVATQMKYTSKLVAA